MEPRVCLAPIPKDLVQSTDCQSFRYLYLSLSATVSLRPRNP